jgi:hypothetical protein
VLNEQKEAREAIEKDWAKSKIDRLGKLLNAKQLNGLK